MLTPSDIMAAKLLVQLGDVTPEQVRAQLRENAADRSAINDLISRLVQRRLLDPPQVRRLQQRVEVAPAGLR